jgi:hypothetical protein
MEYDVKFIPRTYCLSKCALIIRGSLIKAAPVALWNLNKNEWTRKFLVLRRPYLYLYTSRDQLDEEAVMSIFALRLDHGERVSSMLRVFSTMKSLI